MKTFAARILSCVALLAMAFCSAQAQLSTYVFSNAFPGLNFSSPVAIASAPGETNRLFVVEQAGVIVVITNLANPTRTVFLDISGRVDDGGEMGLLGLAFHPGFASNNFFYVFYTGPATNGGGGLHDILSRFQAWTAPWDPNMADPNSELRLFAQLDEAGNHNGGDIHFGADGYLYVSLGDEGGGDDNLNNSQKIDNDFFAGMLRIDVDKRPGSLTPNPHPALGPSINYAVPPDNPYVGATSFNGSSINTNKLRTEFWAVGLRNPWRWSFDPETGFLYCGDVGQGAREEIDIITRGGNYGWNYREGFIAGPRSAPAGFNNRVDPIVDYDRGQGNCVIGGVVYRGMRFLDLIGYYVYSDIGSGRVWALKYNGTNATTPQELFSDGGISAFGIDPSNGDVLYAHLNDSAIKRIVAAVPTGALRVTIQPPAAINDGARWRVDGGPLRTSGTTVGGLSEGDHIVSYRAIAGWAAPEDQAITIESGSTTTTNGAYVNHVLTAALRIDINGSGTVTPNLDGRFLEIGKRYTITAKAGKNFDFWNWSGDVMTNKAKLTFTMQSNLLLIANFKDARRPVLIITSPRENGRVTTPLLDVTGKTKDNVAVDFVVLSLNNQGFVGPAATTNGFTNWIVTGRTPISGVNLVQAQAVDTAGNSSLMAKVKFTYTPVPSADWSPDSLSGLIAGLTPDSGGAQSVSFDDFEFNRTGSSNEDFSIGTYNYLKTTTNAAQLTTQNGAPVTRTNDPPIHMTVTFTNHYGGIYTNDNGGGGVIHFAIATNLVPASLAKKKLILHSSDGTNTTTVALSNHGTFTQKPSRTGTGSSSSGNYLVWRYSPIADFLVLIHPGVDLTVTEVQLTFTSKTAGFYRITSWEGPAVVTDVGDGTFTLQNL